MKHATLYTDIAFCLIILPLMLFIFPVERSWGMHPVFFGLFVCWLYTTYFLYKYLIVPGFFQGGRRRLVALGFVAVSLLVTLLFSSYEITSPLYQMHRQQRALAPYLVWGIRQNRQAVWLHYIVVVIFCVAVGTLTEAWRQRLARQEVEYERNRAELALYKAQINPHFLFNTLNTLYGLLITHSDKTEAMLERFINLIRYMYVNANHEFISLKEEMDYIGQYIELQKLRLNEFADVRFTYKIENEAISVPPMLLITFVENAFKYGISPDEPCFIHICLNQQQENICFEVVNSTFERDIKGSGRMGIENCRRRLSLLYPERHRLDIQRTHEGTFCVRLELISARIGCMGFN